MHKDAPVLGMALIAAAMLALSAMDATIKVLLDGGLAVVQVLAPRSWIVVLVLLAWSISRDGLAGVSTTRPWLHVLRVVSGLGAPLFFFSALRTLPLADATTIVFGATFMTTGLSALVLKEPVGIHRWAAVVVGFAGVVVAMRPTGAMMDAGVFYAFGAAVSYSLLILTTRKLGSGEGTVKQVLYFHVGIGVASTIALPFVYRPFTDGDWALIGLSTVLVIAGHIGMTRALHLAPVALLAPVEYTALIWAAMFGFLIWGDVPSPHTVVGAAIVVASGIYLVFRESRPGRHVHMPVPGVPEDNPGVIE